MHDGILFGVADERILLGSIRQAVIVVVNAAGKAVKAGGANLAIATDHDTPTLVDGSLLQLAICRRIKKATVPLALMSTP